MTVLKISIYIFLFILPLVAFHYAYLNCRCPLVINEFKEDDKHKKWLTWYRVYLFLSFIGFTIILYSAVNTMLYFLPDSIGFVDEGEFLSLKITGCSIFSFYIGLLIMNELDRISSDWYAAEIAIIRLKNKIDELKKPS